MKLQEALQNIKEGHLTEEQLNAYRDDLANLCAQMTLELADIKKKKAMYFLQKRKETDIATKREWQGTPEGLREIELTGYISATKTMLSSLKDRIYRLL